MQPDEVVSGDGSRLNRRADRVLVARRAEFTGTLPVEKQLLERARGAVLTAAARDATTGPRSTEAVG